MSKKTRLNKMCPVAADATIGTQLDLLRTAIVTICAMIDADNGTIGTDYTASVVTAAGLADDGTYDLDAS